MLASTGVRLLFVSMNEGGLSMGCWAALGAACGLWVSSGAHVSIAPSGRGDLAESEWLVRRCMSEESRQAARRKGAPAGAKGWLRVSMCQIASVSLRGEVDLGDLGAALAAQAFLRALIALAVDRGACRRSARLRTAPSADRRGSRWSPARMCRTRCWSRR